MGQKPVTSVPNPNSMNPSEWEEDIYLTNETNSLDYGQLRVMRHRDSQKLVDKYSMFFASKEEFEDYLKSYIWRLEDDYIVKAYHLTPVTKKDYCSTLYQAEVYIRHPKNRLSDFKDIPHPDNLYCLTSMLRGYMKLFMESGRFPIYEEQVCIDETGEVSVWFNRDLSKNYPEEYPIEPEQKQIDEEEEEMVEDIIKVVAENTDSQCEPDPTFLEYYERMKANSRIGFEEALQLVEQYARATGFPVPQFFNSVVEIYGDQNDLYELNGADVSHPTRNSTIHGSQAHTNRSGVRVNSNGDRIIVSHALPIPNTGYTDRSQAMPRPSSHDMNQEMKRSHQLSSLSSNIHDIRVPNHNHFGNEYTQQPQIAYQTNDASKIWKKQSHSEHPSNFDNNSRASGSVRIPNHVYSSGHSHANVATQRMNTVEQEAAIREHQLQMISGSQDGDPLNLGFNQGFNSSRQHQMQRQKSRKTMEYPVHSQNQEYARVAHGRQSPNLLIQNSNSYKTPRSTQHGKAQQQYFRPHTPNGGPIVEIQYQNPAHQGFSFGKNQRSARQAPIQFYDTVDETVELDPQIAADMLIYI